MPSSFGVVEDKLSEADFFLGRLRTASRHSFDANCYFSAFVSASRSVTLAMQVSMKGVLGFEAWYVNAQNGLKIDPLAPYFLEIRNNVVHKGANPLNRVTLEHLREHLIRHMHGGYRGHVLILPDAHRTDATVLVDAINACDEYFASLVSTVYECYSTFKTVVDARWYFTENNFRSMGKSFGDALAELGFPPTWAAGIPIDSRAWRAIRLQQSPCAVNELFQRILGKTIADPDTDLEP